MNVELKAFAEEFETGVAGPLYNGFKAKLLLLMKRQREEAYNEANTNYARVLEERDALQAELDRRDREAEEERQDRRGEAIFNDR
jgi:hypothetical protein